MKDEQKLNEAVMAALKTNSATSEFIDEDGNKVEVKIHTLNPQGFCEWWDD